MRTGTVAIVGAGTVSMSAMGTFLPETVPPKTTSSELVMLATTRAHEARITVAVVIPEAFAL